MFICVDFDGTMVNHVYPLVGDPAPHAVEWCKRFICEGCKIILWTMRSDDELMDAVKYMTSNGIVLYGINENPSQKVWTNSNKAYGHIYIDDAAIGCPLMVVDGWVRPCVDWEMVGPMVLRRIKGV